MGEDRKSSVPGQNDAIDPTRTFDLMIVWGSIVDDFSLAA